MSADTDFQRRVIDLLTEIRDSVKPKTVVVNNISGDVHAANSHEVHRRIDAMRARAQGNRRG